MRLYTSALGFAAIVGILSMSNPRIQDTRDAAELNPDFTAPLKSEVSCIMCDICPGGHFTMPGGFRGIPPGSQHQGCSINGPDCDYWHPYNPSCGGFASLDAPARAALRLAATAGHTDAIRQALESYPEAVKLNVVRSALQVYGCTGDIIASIPLSSGQITALQ